MCGTLCGRPKSSPSLQFVGRPAFVYIDSSSFVSSACLGVDCPRLIDLFGGTFSSISAINSSPDMNIHFMVLHERIHGACQITVIHIGSVHARITEHDISPLPFGGNIAYRPREGFVGLRVGRWCHSWCARPSISIRGSRNGRSCG